MQISVLGPLRVTAAGRSVLLPAKQARLLAILALQPGQTITVDRLIQALWGEDAGPDLVKPLQTHVFHLRRQLAAGSEPDADAPRVVTDGRGYRLEIGSHVIDALEFAALVTRAADAAESAPDVAIEMLADALSLWTGTDVADAGGEPGAAAETARLLEMRGAATEDVIRLKMDSGQYDAAVADLRTALSRSPYREPLWESLMLALAQSGRRAEALVAYRDAERALRQELDVGPGRDLQRLAERIREDDPSLAPVQVADPGTAPTLGEAARPAGAGAVPSTRFGSKGRLATAVGLVGLVGIAVVGLWFATRTSVVGTVPEAGHATSTASAGAPTRAVAIVANSLVELDADGDVVRDTPVGALPDGIVSAAGALWVADTADARVTRIDPATFRQVDVIEVGAAPTGVTAGFGAIWVANSGDGTVSRIDQASGKVVKEIPVGMSPYGIAADEIAVWVTNRLDGTLSRIDPEDNSVRSFAIGQSPLGVTTDGGSVWIADHEAGAVVRFDEQTNTVLDRIDVGPGPAAIAAGSGHVWVTDTRDGTVSRIDPSSRAVEPVLGVGDDPTGLAVGDGGVWVAVVSPPQLVRLDAASGDKTVIHVDGSPRSVVLEAGRPIVSIRGVSADHRGGTLRVAASAAAFPNSADPVHALPWTGNPTLLTNDGLLGYQRVGGPDGTTLVHDLATAIPAPTDDGLTYRFQLEPGIRYSTGAPVRASDVVRSIGRAASIAGPDGEFAAITGAADCGDERPCDLSAGIVADDATGSVTFHLTRADPLFLNALATVAAAIVPADTPFGDHGPLPATGPYMFERFDGTEVRLVRNPTFTVWSAAAQPDGYPEVISWTLVPPGEDPTAVVESGGADVVGDVVDGARADQLALQHPAQLHTALSTKSFVEAMDTTRPPFDDADVRRAVSLAIDREVALRAYGGAIEGRVTCQVMPPTFPGYATYCPFTAGATADGPWTAPDLQRARDLVAGAGAQGAKVTVFGADGPGHREVARHVVTVLNALGLDARVKLVDPIAYFQGDYFAPGNPHGMQMAGLWDASDSPAAASEFLGRFTCPGFHGQPASPTLPVKSCDREVDRLVSAALDLEAAGQRADANLAWQAVDRRVTDDATMVAILNPTDVTFVSSRVGNVQHHLVWQFLLDQMWVR